jgi:hypothetical protein
MSSGLGPREYLIEEVPTPFHKRRNVRLAGAVLLILAIGGGAFGIAQAVSSSSPSAAVAPNSSGGGATGGAGAGPSTPRPGLGVNAGLRGTVEAIASTSFTISTRTQGSQRVGVTSQTTFHSETGVAEHLSDLRVGQAVFVAVAPKRTPYVATSVIVGPAGTSGAGRLGGGRFGANATIGTVQSIGASKFTIEARAPRGSSGTAVAPSTITVVINASTTFTSGQTPGASFSDVKVGEVVYVVGNRSGSTVTASTVGILGAGGRFGGGGGGGFGGPPSGSIGGTSAP